MKSKDIIFRVLFCLCGGLGLLACGVKGDPLPPDQPPFIGRGHPNYNDAFAAAKPSADTKTKAANKGKSDEDSETNEDDEGDE